MTHQYDHERPQRIGMPEAVLCSSKTVTQIEAIASELVGVGTPTLFTRLTEDTEGQLATPITSSWDYDAESRTAILNGCLPDRRGI